MPDLDFQVQGAAAVPFAAAPLLAFRIAVANANAAEPVYSVALRCQIQLEVTRRRYSEQDQQRLLDLFGQPERWSQTLRNMHWTNAGATVPPFTGSTMVEVQVPCTFDFNVAATKYFHGIEKGEIPLCFLFSGSVFYDAGDGTPQVAPVSWSKESRFRLPVATWRDMMETYYPNSAWLCLRRDVFERLYQYKVANGIPTWEAALERILPGLPRGGEIVNAPLVEKIANAVLYEGYILYPYRSSALKNRQRWNFGVVYPRAYTEMQGGIEPWEMETQCLALGGPSTGLSVKVRCLRLVERVAGHLWESRFVPAASIEVGDRAYESWQEASECQMSLPDLRFSELAHQPLRRCFALPAARTVERLRDQMGMVAGMIIRTQEAIECWIEVGIQQPQDGLFRIGVRISNQTPFAGPPEAGRDTVLAASLLSAHTILRIRGGEFVSLLEPPAQFQEAAAACRNRGTWPVLAGETGERHTVLSSPIILYDYPQIAPESPGDLFDGAEIDEILSLRILTLTDEEKSAMRRSDERARRILDRTETLSPEHFMKLHGALRSLHPPIKEAS